MKKKNVGVIGCGKWGKVIIKELDKISNIKFIYNSKNDYTKISDNIDWIFEDNNRKRKVLEESEGNENYSVF